MIHTLLAIAKHEKALLVRRKVEGVALVLIGLVHVHKAAKGLQVRGRKHLRQLLEVLVFAIMIQQALNAVVGILANHLSKLDLLHNLDGFKDPFLALFQEAAVARRNVLLKEGTKILQSGRGHIVRVFAKGSKLAKHGLGEGVGALRKHGLVNEERFRGQEIGNSELLPLDQMLVRGRQEAIQALGNDKLPEGVAIVAMDQRNDLQRRLSGVHLGEVLGEAILNVAVLGLNLWGNGGSKTHFGCLGLADGSFYAKGRFPK